MATAWLRRVLSAAVRDDVLRDFAHHYAERARTDGRFAALRWYWRQTALATIATLRDRERNDSPRSGRSVGMAMESLIRDLRYAARLLRHHRGFTATAVLTLALGIGANTAMFGVLHAVVLRPLPYPNPEQLVFVSVVDNDGRHRLSGQGFRDLRDGADAFEELVQIKGVVDDVMETADGAVAIERRSISGNIFRTYGVAPALGRDFVPEDRILLPPDVIQDANAVRPTSPVVIGHTFWAREFGKDPAVIGRVLRFGGRPFEVIGVMPEGFQTYLPPDLPSREMDAWYLSPWDETAFPRRIRFIATIGRLADGRTLAHAQEQADAVAQRVRSENADLAGANFRFEITPLHDEVVSDASKPLVVLFGAVSLVLLIACTNVANLLLARGTSRGREIAVRTALGATRVGLVRQSLTESAMLAAFGTGLGLLMALWGTDALIGLAPAGLPRLESVAIDETIFGFTVLVAAAATLVFGTLPAARLLRVAPATALHGRGIVDPGTSGGRGRSRQVLVAGQVALSLVLVIATGLLLQSFVRLNRVDLGFDTNGVLAAYFPLPGSKIPDSDANIAFMRRLDDRIRQIPGVTASTIAANVPLQGIQGLNVDPEGPVEQFGAGFWVSTPGFVETLGLELAEGRMLQWSDLDRTDRLMTLVDDRFAERAWPGQTAIGKRIRLQLLKLDDDRDVWNGIDEAEVIGVVRRIRGSRPHTADPPTFFVSYRLYNGGGRTIALRTDGDPMALAEPLRAAMNDVDRTLPLADIWSLADEVRAATLPLRFSVTLLGVFGVLGVLLAVVGIYGVMAYNVAQRRGEYCTRMALGADWRDIARLVFGRGLVLTAAGVVVGVAVSLVVGRVLEGQLFGVTARDPVTYVGVIALMSAVAALAIYLPARRAWRDDPMAALRTE